MRRTLLAVTASGLLLLSTACNTDSSAPEAQATEAPVIATSAPFAPPAKSTDGKTCKKLKATIDDVTAKFGNELASILAAKSQNDQAGLALARRNAHFRLEELAYKLRQESAKADAAVKAAAEETAARVERSDKDATFYTKLETTGGTLAPTIADWEQPLKAACP
ncbi:MAG TPA: hypothetical protein VFO77_09520 [Actinoplanes sp.]|nr:hypothetical protein [Actinoplanes sp.]